MNNRFNTLMKIQFVAHKSVNKEKMIQISLWINFSFSRDPAACVTRWRPYWGSYSVFCLDEFCSIDAGNVPPDGGKHLTKLNTYITNLIKTRRDGLGRYNWGWCQTAGASFPFVFLVKQNRFLSVLVWGEKTVDNVTKNRKEKKKK